MHQVVRQRVRLARERDFVTQLLRPSAASSKEGQHSSKECGGGRFDPAATANGHVSRVRTRNVDDEGLLERALR